MGSRWRVKNSTGRRWTRRRGPKPEKLFTSSDPTAVEDLTWRGLLTSYARDGFPRVEAAGGA